MDSANNDQYQSSASYIHLVQHLIEECLLFKMSREECMEALSNHANIHPLITSTVWKELQKENKEFFEFYYGQWSPLTSPHPRRRRTTAAAEDHHSTTPHCN